jgi:hypothetical protein
MTNEVIARDPLGKSVFLIDGIFFSKKEPDEIYDDAATVIKKPAMIVEVNEHERTEFYYFRSVGWNNTLLITVHFNNKSNRWEAHDYIKNPSSHVLSNLLKKGRQIY